VAEQRRFDAIELFREVLTQWEREFDALANRFMGTDEFSNVMNQVQRLQLELQRRFNQHVAEQLANFNVPSREDVIRLGETLRDVESRLGRIERLLKDMAEPAVAGSNPARPAGPPRTRQPPSRTRSANQNPAKESAP